jgi:hypothetical protein
MSKIGIALFLIVASFPALAQIPGILSYQGIIVDPATGEAVANGSYPVRLKFFDAAVDGNLKWETEVISVTTNSGLFTTLIPVPADASWDQPLFVQVTAAETTFNDRIHLTTVAYAFRANTSSSAATMNAAGLTGTVPAGLFSAHLEDLADGSLTGSKIGTGINANAINTGILSGNLIGAGVEASRITTGVLTSEVMDEDLHDLADATLSGAKIGPGINAGMVTDGTLPNERLSEHLKDFAASGIVSPDRLSREEFSADLVDHGTVPDGVLSPSLQDLADGTVSGSAIGTGINAANVDTGVLPVAVMPSMPNHLSGAGTNGQIAFWLNSKQVVADNLYWNSNENRLGIIVPVPSAILHVRRNRGLSGPAAMLIDHSSDVVSSKFGVDLNISTNPSSQPIVGILSNINDTGTGDRWGMKIEVGSPTNNSTVYGTTGFANGTGSGVHTGVSALVNSTGTGSNYAIYGKASGIGTQTKYGVHAIASGSGILKHGVRGEASGTGTNQAGVYGVASGATNNYGVYGSAAGVGNYAIYASGNIMANGTINAVLGWASDRKLKTNISHLSSGLETIMQLNPSTYYFRRNRFSSMRLPSGKNSGLIAQDVEKIFPTLVKETVTPAGGLESDGSTREAMTYKSLNYVSLIPVLIRAMQEQQAIIERLKSKIAELKKED